jgi:hypothetical protein
VLDQNRDAVVDEDDDQVKKADDLKNAGKVMDLEF